MKTGKHKGGPVRKTFRWCRRGTYVVCLILGCFLVYLNQVGVPEWVKRPLLAQLRDRGIELEFSRMRIRLTRGLVAENVNLSRRQGKPGEVFFTDELQLRLRWSALMEFNPPEITALTLRNGRITLPLETGTDSGPFPFAVDHVQARLRFVSANLWELDSLEATCHGGTFSAHGTLSNAASLRIARPALTNVTDPTVTWRRQLLDAVRWMEGTSFRKSPEVHVVFNADLERPALSSGEIRLASASASNVLGAMEGLRLVLRMDPPNGHSNPVQGSFDLEADRAVTRWGGFDALRLGAKVEWRGSNAIPDVVDWTLQSRNATSRWASASMIEIAGMSRAVGLVPGPGAPWGIPPTNSSWATLLPGAPGFDSTVSLSLRGIRIPTFTNAVTLDRLKVVTLASHSTSDWRSLHFSFDVSGATSAWSAVPSFQAELGLTPNLHPPATRADWSYWQRLVHVDAWASASVGPTQVPRMQIDGANFGLVWSAPRLEVIPFQAWFGDGDLSAEAMLDVATRRAVATAFSTADPHAVEGWMNAKSQEQIRQYGWEKPSLPRLSGQVGITLPGWGIPDREARLLIHQSLTLDAKLDGTNISFRGLPTTTAHGPITYTNRYWRIGPLDIARPEGSLQLRYENDEETRDYRFDFRSSIDPMIVRPLLDEKIQKEIDRVSLPQTPRVEGVLWGRWQEPERIGFQLHLSLSNAVVRGEPIEWADGDVLYTNRFLTFREVRARSDGDAYVPGAAFDIASQKLSFTNAHANVPVLRVARIIGTNSAAVMAPYEFVRPPHAVVDGVVSVRSFRGTDIRFDVRADDFRWWHLRGTNLDARLQLRGETLSISNLHAAFCGGSLAGDLFFDWSDAEGDTDYRLGLSVTNVSLKEFLSDVWPKTNRLEGRVSGRGEITSASTADPRSIRGQGTISMQDGYLWGLPIFGLFSPIFDVVSPGLGETRFTSGSASFRLADGNVDTRDFEMRSMAMRLRYRGIVSYQGNLDATMEAALFRDAPLIGRLLSFAFMPVTKLLEYRIEGTLADPKPEPRYVPRILMNLLSPISFLKSLLPKSDKSEKPEPPPEK
jgi:hypothetical protein